MSANNTMETMTLKCRICGSIYTFEGYSIKEELKKMINYCDRCDHVDCLYDPKSMELNTIYSKPVVYSFSGTEGSGIDYNELVNKALSDHPIKAEFIKYCDLNEKPFPLNYQSMFKKDYVWFTNSHLLYEDDYGRTYISVYEFVDTIAVSIYTSKWWGTIGTGRRITMGETPYICANCGGNGCEDCSWSGMY